ncbi:MAG TPA: hypothetical protein VMK32_10290 [Burkholderiaceae bacterium]|nr:hypothetical protein [Burkholderiaceae bacterium]
MSPRRLIPLIPAFVVLVLAACGTPGSVAPGATEPAVRSKAGTPSAVIPLQGGGTRWQYSGQPFNQLVWNIDFDASGKVVRTEQMMSDTAFAKIRSGQDSRLDVLRDFGPPAEAFSFPLKNETAYMYRYFDDAGWYAAMFVYFNPAGIVTRTETGMDPWRLRGGDGGRQ